MYLEKMKSLSRPLVAILTLCLIFTMAPLLPMNDSEVDAAVGQLPITNGKDTLVTFSAVDLDSLPQISNIYSSLNTFDTFSTYSAMGASIDSILRAADIDTSRLASTTDLIFYAYYKKGNVYQDYPVSWKVLSEKRYTFDTSVSAIGTPVPSIINSPNASSDSWRVFVGQLTGKDTNNGYFVKDVEGITISPAAVKFLSDQRTVTLNGNGGKAPVASFKVYPGETYGTIANATRGDYAFKGWYTAAKGGSKVIATTKITNKNNHTLYAQWTGTNKNLKSLKASKGKFTKKFKATRTKYTLKLKKSQSKTKITAKKAQSVAKVQIKVGKGKYKTKSSITVKLKKGKSKTVYIKVKAQNGKTKTYKVVVKRAK